MERALGNPGVPCDAADRGVVAKRQGAPAHLAEERDERCAMRKGSSQKTSAGETHPGSRKGSWPGGCSCAGLCPGLQQGRTDPPLFPCTASSLGGSAGSGRWLCVKCSCWQQLALPCARVQPSYHPGSTLSCSWEWQGGGREGRQQGKHRLSDGNVPLEQHSVSWLSQPRICCSSSERGQAPASAGVRPLDRP